MLYEVITIIVVDQPPYLFRYPFRGEGAPLPAVKAGGLAEGAAVGTTAAGLHQMHPVLRRRITSYNVCYTKLLRSVQRRRVEGQTLLGQLETGGAPLPCPCRGQGIETELHYGAGGGQA